MAKVVEGQLSWLNMVQQQSGISNSLASSNIRTAIEVQNRLQSHFPDVLPRMVEVRPLIESDTGKLVSRIG